MPDGDGGARYEPLDYSATLANLTDLVGREVLAELRVGDLHGPFRLAARGVLVDTPAGQPELTGRRRDGDDLEAFMLDNGGFLAVKQADFVSRPMACRERRGPVLGTAAAEHRIHGFGAAGAVLWRHDRAAPQNT